MKGRAGWRVGLGPVFVYEWLKSSRRWQGYALRAGFLLLLLTALVVVSNWQRPAAGRPPIRTMALLGQWFYIGVVGTQLALVLVAAPAATAGAICVDRSRGTLSDMLVTDLSSAEIVLGKLAARLVPVLGLLGCTLPLMEILSLVGGVEPGALFGAFAVSVGVALLGCSLALLFSLWAGKTHEALLATYAVWGLWLLWPQIMWLVRIVFPASFRPPFSADPFWLVFAPYWAPTAVAWEDYAWFLGITSGLAALVVGAAVLRLRPIVTRDVVRRRPSRSLMNRLRERLAPGRLLPTWSLDWNPVFWREWHRSKPSRRGFVVRMVYFALAASFSLAALVFHYAILAVFVNGVHVSVGLLVLSATAAASLAEDRARGSLDLLMTTMLSTRQIVLGKWLGIYRAVPLLAALPAIVAFGFVYKEPERWPYVSLIIFYVLCAGAAMTSLGLAMATWVGSVGTAVTATVSVYVFITLGWIFLVFLLYPLGLRLEEMLLASPLVWSVFMTAKVVIDTPWGDEIPGWAVRWSLVLATSAFALLLATLTSFDRQFGRIRGPWLWNFHGDFARRERGELRHRA